LTLEERFSQIDQAYRVYLRENGLDDAPLARMSYLQTIKKVFLEDPLESDDDQTAVLNYLDRRITVVDMAMRANAPVVQKTLYLPEHLLKS
jgi:hypothetical protein